MVNNKSKLTGTIHVRTTPEPIRTSEDASNVANSTVLVVETGRTASDQDTTADAADASANAIVADDAIDTSVTEDAASKSVFNTAPVPSPAESLLGGSAANTAPGPTTLGTEPVAAVADTKTKMEIATEIFKRLKKVKGITRKAIIDQFVVEAKLSKAGASTYYQLIKAEAKEK